MSFFFFQAEDGIRDLVRSRGLGDVYKRQLLLLRLETLRCALFIQRAKDTTDRRHRYLHLAENFHGVPEMKTQPWPPWRDLSDGRVYYGFGMLQSLMTVSRIVALTIALPSTILPFIISLATTLSLIHI